MDFIIIYNVTNLANILFPVYIRKKFLISKNIYIIQILNLFLDHLCVKIIFLPNKV